MKKQLSKKQPPLLTTTIALLAILSSTYIHSAAEPPSLNIEVCWELWRAALKGDVKAAQQALDDGADINGGVQYKHIPRYSHDLLISTPLEVATMAHENNMIRFLLENGALPDVNFGGDTTLGYMCGHGQPTTIKGIVLELLKYKADINAQVTDKKLTPLMSTICFQQDKNDLVKLLIFANANIDLIDKNGVTAFNMINSHLLLKTFSEAYAINNEAFQQLEVLGIIARIKILHYHVPIDNLTELITDYAVPYYESPDSESADHDPLAYDILNERITQQWINSKEKIKLTKQLRVHYLTEKDDDSTENPKKQVCSFIKLR